MALELLAQSKFAKCDWLLLLGISWTPAIQRILVATTLLRDSQSALEVPLSYDSLLILHIGLVKSLRKRGFQALKSAINHNLGFLESIEYCEAIDSLL